MLRAFVELVLNVASTFRMKARRVPVNATPTTPLDLPERTTDTQSQETTPAAQHRSPPIALILRSAAKLRVSKDEGVLTTPSVSHAPRAIHLPHTACGGGKPRTVATKGNLPPPVRSTGGGGSPRLRGETEGAQAKPTVTSGSVNSVHALPAKAGIQPSSEKARKAPII
jgi:hypothetical protein